MAEQYEEASKKAKKQLREFVRTIKEKRKKLTVLQGVIQHTTMKIIMHKKGEYDLITTGAIDKIKMNGRAILSYTISEQISALLKKEKGVEFRRANCEIKIRGHIVRVSPLIIKKKKPCAVLGRKSTDLILEQIIRTRRIGGAQVTKDRNVRKLVRQWMNEDKRDLEETQKDSSTEETMSGSDDEQPEDGSETDAERERETRNNRSVLSQLMRNNRRITKK